MYAIPNTKRICSKSLISKLDNIQYMFFVMIDLNYDWINKNKNIKIQGEQL